MTSGARPLYTVFGIISRNPGFWYLFHLTRPTCWCADTLQNVVHYTTSQHLHNRHKKKTNKQLFQNITTYQVHHRRIEALCAWCLLACTLPSAAGNLLTMSPSRHIIGLAMRRQHYGTVLHETFKILRGPPFNLQGGGGEGFGDGPKYFFHYDPADTYFLQLPCHWIIYFTFTLELFQLYLEGNYLFQYLAATNYLFYHLLAWNYLFQKSLSPPGD